jgi:hypothetical protein
MQIIITLTKEDVELLRKDTKGKGGWQSYLESLKSRLKGRKITLEIEDVIKIIRYSKGQGGYQTRLGTLLTQIVFLENAILTESKKKRKTQ